MRRLALNSDLSAYDQAPAEVELIPAPDPASGRVTGRDKRSWVFDSQAHEQVLGSFGQRGISLPIDWEHATQHRAPNGEEAPAAAWIERIEVRSGALWGHVKWTPRGEQQVANKEYRFLSPVFDYEPKTGRIARLVSAGLTNTPNLHLQALNQEENHMQRSTLLAAAIVASLGLTDSADDDAVANAINQLKQDRDTATALNSEKAPSLDRYVPRADYDALITRATNAEQALQAKNKAEQDAAVDTAIKDALKAGKITPATEDYHRASCADTAGLERFKAFVTAAPAVGDPTDMGKRKPDGSVTALNAEQKEACRLLGIPEADYLAELGK